MFEIFPVLSAQAHRKAGELSGGQQQMVAMGQALMTGARLMLLDEPCGGLAPAAIQDDVRRIGVLQDLGIGVLDCRAEHFECAGRLHPGATSWSGSADRVLRDLLSRSRANDEVADIMRGPSRMVRRSSPLARKSQEVGSRPDSAATERGPPGFNRAVEYLFPLTSKVSIRVGS